ALITTKLLSPSACRPAKRSAADHPLSGQRRSTSLIRAFGAPSALKLPRLERFDSSFTVRLATPSAAARRGRGQGGVGCAERHGQEVRRSRAARPLETLSTCWSFAS